MVVLIANRAYEMGDKSALELAEAASSWSRGIGAIERDGVIVLVNEPWSEERERELETDGWRLFARRRAHL